MHKNEQKYDCRKNSTVLFTTVYLLSFPKQALKLGSKL